MSTVFQNQIKYRINEIEILSSLPLLLLFSKLYYFSLTLNQNLHDSKFWEKFNISVEFLIN